MRHNALRAGDGVVAEYPKCGFGHRAQNTQSADLATAFGGMQEILIDPEDFHCGTQPFSG